MKKVFSVLAGASISLAALLSASSHAAAIDWRYIVVSPSGGVKAKATAWEGQNSGGRYYLFCGTGRGSGKYFTTNYRHGSAHDGARHMIQAHGSQGWIDYCGIRNRNNG